MPVTYNIDDVFEGYNNHEKLLKIYNDFRKEIATGEPIQSSPINLVSINSMSCERVGNYGWQLFQIKESFLMLEYFGFWNGSASESRRSPVLGKSLSQKISMWEAPHHIIITAHNSTSELDGKIRDIITRYPRESKKSQLEEIAT
jgi:hypothetical protein